jgi:hypothetical protein
VFTARNELNIYIIQVTFCISWLKTTRLLSAETLAFNSLTMEGLFPCDGISPSVSGNVYEDLRCFFFWGGGGHVQTGSGALPNSSLIDTGSISLGVWPKREANGFLIELSSKLCWVQLPLPVLTFKTKLSGSSTVYLPLLHL